MHLKLSLHHIWPQKSQIADPVTRILLTGTWAAQWLQLRENIDAKRMVVLSAGVLVINISKNFLTGVTLGIGPILAYRGLSLLFSLGNTLKQIRFGGRSGVDKK